jgi:hypothetical protein
MSPQKTGSTPGCDLRGVDTKQLRHLFNPLNCLGVPAYPEAKHRAWREGRYVRGEGSVEDENFVAGEVA